MVKSVFFCAKRDPSHPTQPFFSLNHTKSPKTSPHIEVPCISRRSAAAVFPARRFGCATRSSWRRWCGRRFAPGECRTSRRRRRRVFGVWRWWAWILDQIFSTKNPLVMSTVCNWKWPWKLWIFPLIAWWFSIAMLNYQRVTMMDLLWYEIWNYIQISSSTLYGYSYSML